jgi:ribulose-phosphate 3-epimerase
MPVVKILPSVLGADPGNLEAACKTCVSAGADGIHVDVMDGHFVPNLAYGPGTVAMIDRVVDTHLNVHLMITNPLDHAEAFIRAGSDTLTVHIEAEGDIAALLPKIRALGARPGIVLNPDTPLSRVLPVVDAVEEVLFMTVFPGFGGQSFIADAMPGIAELRAHYPGLDIAVDGGLNRETCRVAHEAGANVALIRSALQ